MRSTAKLRKWTWISMGVGLVFLWPALAVCAEAATAAPGTDWVELALIGVLAAVVVLLKLVEQGTDGFTLPFLTRRPAPVRRQNSAEHVMPDTSEF